MMQPYPADLRTPHGSTSQLLDEDDASSSDSESPRDAQAAVQGSRKDKSLAEGTALMQEAQKDDDTARPSDQQEAETENERIWRHAKQKLGMKPGERFYPNSGGPSYRQNSVMASLALFTMALYLGWIHVLSALFVASFYSSFVAVLLAGIWATVLLPAKPLLWDRFLSFPMWTLWRNYFNFSMAYDTEMDLSQQYILAEVPHGVFPLSQLVAISSVKDTWPGHKVYGIAASSVFNVPLWRHVMTWLGTCPATEHNFKKLLRHGGTVGVVPGGIAEIFMGQDDAEVVKIKDRKGFARMAVEHGVQILPVYHFGNSRLFRWVPQSWEGPSRKYRVALGFMLGRWNLPLPHKVPLFMVVGGPVPVKHVKRGEPGFEAAVEEAHAATCAALEQLYMKYRGMYGWHDRPLIMK